jgi:twitching motility protein PilT
MAAEVLVVTPAIRSLIRDDKVHQIYSSMQAGKKWGMQTLNDALYQLYMNREVTADECLRVSGDPTEFQRMIGQLDPADEGRTGQPPAGKPGQGRPAPGSPAKR